MIVTAIEPRKGTLYDVYVEGELALTVDMEVLAREHLKAGKEVDRDALMELRRSSELQRARERALRLLEMRSYTEQGLRDKLAADYDPDIAKEISGRMVELGLVDDAAYARRYARSQAAGKGYGPGRIRQDLLQKGIDRDLAAEVLDELADEFDADAKLLELIQRKYQKNLGDPKGVERTIAALQRRGYRYAEIRRALDAANAAETLDEED